MSLFDRPIQLLYQAIRRLRIVDATRLMHLPAGNGPRQVVADGYEIRAVRCEELRHLVRDQRAPEFIGNAGDLTDGHRALIAAFAQGHVVSFLWLARQRVPAADNFSRAAHLGTSIDLPDGTAFVYNAWTHPEHRGRRLISGLVAYALENRVSGAWSLLTSIDWTNARSIRAFQFLGMTCLGTVVRAGRGPAQISLIPSVASGMGIRIAEEAPGCKVAI